MYNSRHNKTRVLGYVYLFLAILGIFYYVLSFTVSFQSTTPNDLVLIKSSKTMMLLCLLLELFLGIYIVPSSNKIILFFQSLATMLLLAAHGFYVYAYFSIQSKFGFTSENASDAGLTLLVISALLHLTFPFSDKLNKMLKSKEPVIEREDPFADLEDDY